MIKLCRKYIILGLKINLFTSDIIYRSILTLGEAHCYLGRFYLFLFLVVNLSPVIGYIQR